MKLLLNQQLAQAAAQVRAMRNTPPALPPELQGYQGWINKVWQRAHKA